MHPHTLTKFPPIYNEGQRYAVSLEEVPHRAPFSKLRLVIDDYASPRRVLSAGPELDTPIALLRSGNRHAATRTPIYINSLALALFARFQRNGDLLDLQDAVSKFREAASLPGASASARQSTTFAVALCAYFFVSHDLNDLDEAISKFKQAVAMTPDGHPDLPGYVASLRDAYALQRSCTCHASEGLPLPDFLEWLSKLPSNLVKTSSLGFKRVS